MSEFRFFFVALLLLAASSALSQDIRYNFDGTTDFSKFRTYKWVTLMSEAPIEKLTDKQIKAALNAALARKGLTKIDGDSTADLLIAYQTTGHHEEQFAGLGWSPGPGWRSTGSGKSWTIYKGELAVAMSDAAKQVLVWRGVARKALDPKAAPEKRQLPRKLSSRSRQKARSQTGRK